MAIVSIVNFVLDVVHVVLLVVLVLAIQGSIRARCLRTGLVLNVFVRRCLRAAANIVICDNLRSALDVPLGLVDLGDGHWCETAITVNHTSILVLMHGLPVLLVLFEAAALAAVTAE